MTNITPPPPKKKGGEKGKKKRKEIGKVKGKGEGILAGGGAEMDIQTNIHSCSYSNVPNSSYF